MSVMSINYIKSVFKNKVIGDTSLYALGNISSQGLSLLILPLFTHYLTTEDFGIYNYTNSIKAVLAVVTTLSLNSFVLRYYFKLKSEQERNKLIGTIFLFLLGLSSLLLIAEYIIFPIIINSFALKIPFH